MKNNQALAKTEGTSVSNFDLKASQSQLSKRVSINVKEERIHTVVSHDASFVGDMDLKDGIKIDGHIKGNVAFGAEDGLAIISKNATLQGNLRGPRALVMGTIEGDVFIHGLLMLSPTALVMGNIYYDRMVMHDGAQVAGTMNLMRGETMIEARTSLEGNVVRPLRATS